MMKLYETRVAPNPRRVRVFIAEKGLTEQGEYIEVNLQAGENLTPEFRQRNPMKKVPVLELEDGTCISETMAICRYLEAAYPETPRLLGESAKEIALIEQWNRWIDFFYMMPTGMAFQHLTGYFKDRMTPNQAWGEACKSDAEKFFAFLDQQLEGRRFLCGEQFTAADISAVCVLDFNKVIQQKIQDDQSNLLAWYERVNQRPSITA